jgi:hypothetical protein
VPPAHAVALRVSFSVPNVLLGLLRPLARPQTDIESTCAAPSWLLPYRRRRLRIANPRTGAEFAIRSARLRHVEGEMDSPVNGHEGRQRGNIADPYLDLLSELADGPRKGLVQRLATGYYEGWRPTRTQLANLIARETGRMTEDEYLALVRTRNPQDPRQRPYTNGSRNPLEPGRRPVPDDGKMPVFTVACGELTPSADFVARGLSSAGWVRRGSGTYRLVSLHYDLIPCHSLTMHPKEALVFTGRISCRPDVPAPPQPGDGQSIAHSVGAERIVGTRGPWPVSADVRHIRFLIYRPARPDDATPQPAGALWVDLERNEALWRPLADRRPESADRTLAVEPFAS